MMQAQRSALRIAGVYTLGGLAWIVLSDSALLEFSDSTFALAWLQTLKGVVFVAVTAIFFYVYVRRDLEGRDRTGTALRDSERLAYATLDAQKAHICVLDENGVIVAVNKSWNDFAAQNGGDPALLGVGANYLAVCDRAGGPRAAEAAPFAAGVRSVLQGDREEFTLEYPCPSEEDPRWFSATVTRFAGPGPVRVVIAHENITDRKQAEHSLTLFRTLVDRANDAIEVVDPATGRYLDVNDKGCQVLGYTREEFLSLHVVDVDPIADQAAINENVKRIRESGFVIWNGLRRRKDGTTFPVEVNLSLAHRDRDYIIAVVRDITERVEQEGQFQVLGSALEAAANGIVITDAQGRIQWANPAFEFMTGFELGEVKGRTPRFLKSDKQDPAFYKNLWDTILAGQVWRDEIVNRRKDGAFYTEEMTITPVKNRDGRISHFIAIKNDVTRRKQAEQALQALNDTLEQRVKDRTQAAEAASRAKSQFLANMSHELRTPLNSVIGFSQLLADPTFGELNKRQARYAHNIQSSGQHLLQVINDILDLSKIEAGHMDLALGPLHAREKVAEAITVVAPLAARKGIAIRTNLDPGPPVVQADEAKFLQIMINLLNNAVKFTPVGGSVDVGARGLADGSLEVSVADNGIGIKPEDQERIFGEFVQLDSTYSRRQEGTGLGLPLVRRLTELHGGSVRVTSEGVPGEGSVFTVVFPARHPVATGTVRAPAKTLLMIDDEPGMISIMQRAFEQAGFRTVQATNGRDGISCAVEYRPSVMVVDMVMPGISGLELIDELKSLPAVRGIPLVVFTGHRLPETELALVRQRVHAVIFKPALDELIRVVSAVAKGKS